MKRIFTWFLCLVLCLGAIPGAYADPPEASGDTLRVGYSFFNGQFSPFLAETAYDQDAVDMTQIDLLTCDRTGAMVLKGIEGETHIYGTDSYTYYGPADLTITENADFTVYYDFTLRSDLKFSDGTPLTVDDVIFSMYVLADPTYSGTSTFFALPIQGMNDYRAGFDTLVNLLIQAGRDNTDFTYWTEAVQTAFWDAADQAALALAWDIVDYLVNNGYCEEGDIQGAAAKWGFDIADNTIESFVAALWDAYGNDIITMMNVERTTKTSLEYFPTLTDYTGIAVQTGESADSISGIQRIDDCHLRVVMTEINAMAIYQLGVSIVPMHYYGDAAKYDYAHNKFGFDKGDLRTVLTRNAQPMGAGLYRFVSYENGVIRYEANEHYYLGTPLTRYVEFVEGMSSVEAVVNGTVDIADPSFSGYTIDAITAANGNGELTGDTITTYTTDNLGYGYIGQNAINVSVGNDPASAASRALRKAFATEFAVYRDAAIQSYYGERATVIQYPISNSSWAAPRPGEEGFRTAFSLDRNGNEIYTAGMTEQQRYDAALQAALGFFEEAGYTVENGRLTAAPEGAKLEYTFWIPGDGSGDHPSFMIVDMASRALGTIGMNLIIHDLTNAAELWSGLDAIQLEMWAAAWGSTVDPDMTQIYFSDVANGPTTAEGKNPMGGPNQGGSNYEYCIADPDLDDNIKAALASTDQDYRRSLYKICLDIIMDWAVEIPTYQRQNAVIVSTQRVDISSLERLTTFYGWMSQVEKIRTASDSLPLQITGQPVDFTGALNETASFTVEAVGNGLTYQWQYKSLKDGKWYNTKTDGYDTPAMYIGVTAARDGMQFRCKVKDAAGSEVISDPATLHVLTGPTITSQPEDFTGPLNATASFTVAAEGTNLTYQWQYKSLKDGKWYNTKTAGCDTPTMSIAVTAARNGMQFRCKVTGSGGSVTSEPATLHMTAPAVVITSQPEDFTGAIGETASFTVEAQGEGLTYQWQYKSLKDGKWYDTKTAGYDTPTMSIAVTNSRNGMQFRCKVTGGGTTVTSDPATLRVGTVLAITSQPEDFIGSIGDMASFTVAAEGEGLTYQWQYKSLKDGRWYNTKVDGYDTPTMHIDVTNSRNGMQFRCKVMDAAGSTVISDPATLRVG